MLPERSQVAEDAFVADWATTEDTEALLDVITEAMAARRPLLAARLVNLLDEHVEIEPGSPVERAWRAARLVVREERPEDRSWSELEDAWAEVRRSRMRRIRLRQRQQLAGRAERVGRLSGRKRR